MNNTFWKGKKVSVPGGGGFVGSRIVARLRSAGAEVFAPRTADGIDFRRREDCEEHFAKTKPEIVINCAAHQGGIGFHKGREGELFMDNMRMGLFLMETAEAAGVKKFVNVVAGCSYPGYLEKDELNEEDYWNGAVHESIFSYGFSRKASVGYGAALARQNKWNSIHLIMANMYGPGEHFNPEQSKALAGMLKKIYEAKKSGAPAVEIWGTGAPVRDWLYVDDGVEGILRAAEGYDEVEPLNIASGVGISVKDLALIIKQVVGYTGEFTYNTSRPDGAQKKTFGIHHMQARLGWVPETPLEDGIRKTLEWLDANYDYAIAH